MTRGGPVDLQLHEHAREASDPNSLSSRKADKLLLSIDYTLSGSNCKIFWPVAFDWYDFKRQDV